MLYTREISDRSSSYQHELQSGEGSDLEEIRTRMAGTTCFINQPYWYLRVLAVIR